MNQNNTPVIWTMIICSAVLLILGFVGVDSIGNKIVTSNENAPTSEGVANAVLAGLVIPAGLTAEDIAALVPEQDDTYYSVNEKINNKAIELATNELDTKDFKKKLRNRLNSCNFTAGPNYCDSQTGADNPDIEDYKDIESIVVKDADTPGLPIIGDIVVKDADTSRFPIVGKTRYVEFELRVTYLNDGDSDDLQEAKVFVRMRVIDLDYDDDFEDAEVRYGFNFGDIKVYED